MEDGKRGCGGELCLLKMKGETVGRTMVRKLKWAINQKALTRHGTNNIMKMFWDIIISNKEQYCIISWLDIPV